MSANVHILDNMANRAVKKVDSVHSLLLCPLVERLAGHIGVGVAGRRDGDFERLLLLERRNGRSGPGPRRVVSIVCSSVSGPIATLDARTAVGIAAIRLQREQV